MNEATEPYSPGMLKIFKTEAANLPRKKAAGQYQVKK